MTNPQPKRRITATMIGMFFFAIVPAIGTGVLAYWIYPDGPWPVALGFGLVWLGFTTFALIRQYRDQPEVDRQQAVKQQLNEMLTAGDTLAHSVESILDAQDRKALRRGFWRPLPVIVIFIVILLWLAMRFNPYISLIALIPAAIGAYGWYFMHSTITKNRKAILRGIVTSNTRRKYDIDDTTINFYLTVGDVTFKTNEHIHDEYEVGDIVELHYAGPTRGGKVKQNWSYIIRHRKMTPEEYKAWLEEFQAR